MAIVISIFLFFFSHFVNLWSLIVGSIICFLGPILPVLPLENLSIFLPLSGTWSFGGQWVTVKWRRDVRSHSPIPKTANASEANDVGDRKPVENLLQRIGLKIEPVGNIEFLDKLESLNFYCVEKEKNKSLTNVVD